MQSDNGPEFTSREFNNFLIEQNNEQKFGPPYRPQWQGAVESFNKTVQKFLEMAWYQQASKFDMEESVSDFLYYYNGRKHSTTGVTPFEVMRNMDDKDMIEKVKE